MNIEAVLRITIIILATAQILLIISIPLFLLYGCVLEGYRVLRRKYFG